MLLSFYSSKWRSRGRKTLIVRTGHHPWPRSGWQILLTYLSNINRWSSQVLFLRAIPMKQRQQQPRKDGLILRMDALRLWPWLVLNTMLPGPINKTLKPGATCTRSLAKIRVRINIHYNPVIVTVNWSLKVNCFKWLKRLILDAMSLRKMKSAALVACCVKIQKRACIYIVTTDGFKQCVW